MAWKVLENSRGESPAIALQSPTRGLSFAREMNRSTLIRKTAFYHLRSHLGTIVGVAIAGAVLVGALAVGDSIRATLRHLALERLGKIHFALAPVDRFFTESLAGRFREESGASAAAVLHVTGTASAEDAKARANRVEIFGVDPSFWALAEKSNATVANPGNGVFLNTALAAQLQARAGDTVLFRMEKPSALSREAPVSSQADSSVALRLTVSAVIADESLGRFGLRPSQIPPLNAFVDLKVLQGRLEQTNHANLLLTGANGRLKSATEAQSVLEKVWRLADAELEAREIETTHHTELRTSRVFLDAPVIARSTEKGTNASLLLTYFVNELRHGEKAAPYSMVTAAPAPWTSSGMRDDQIRINEWLARDLGVKAGDSIEIKYYVLNESQHLEERSARFQVFDIVPLAGIAADRELMPDFPGLSKAESSHDWNTGFPIDLTKIRDQDERYWKEFRGTPKAFVTLAAGRNLWKTRFGDVTAIRFPTQEVSAKQLSEEFRNRLRPAEVGLFFEPVREEALAASGEGQDFGELFLGFSFFLIVSALLLMSLLFQFTLERRSRETGLFLALGFSPRRVSRILWTEGMIMAVVGGLIGTMAGLFYARGILAALTTIWKPAVGTSALLFAVTGTSVGIGFAATLLLCAGTLWLGLRGFRKKSARQLLSEQGSISTPAVGARRIPWFSLANTLIAATLLIAASANREAAVELFFGGGAMALAAALAWSGVFLRRLETADDGGELSTAALGLRGMSRRRRRSLGTLALLACGTFLVIAVGANRLSSDEDSHRRNSGTGGFPLMAESTLPVLKNLNSREGREYYGLSSTFLTNVSVISLRVHSGDDASCLNLNRAQRPRLLGVPTLDLASRKAFVFAGATKGFSSDSGWDLLKTKFEDGVIPAIADKTTIDWALRTGLGKTLDYTDQHGSAFKVRLIAAIGNSILQGSLLIDEEEFLRRFPGESGFRMFLIDAPSNEANGAAGELSRGLRDLGFEVIATPRRLADLNAVENTYLSTFQILGGLGLLLGTVGLAILVLRNVLERKGELAVLRAIGFRESALRRLVLTEHVGLLFGGLLIGSATALLAVAPALSRSGEGFPAGEVTVTIAVLLVFGVASVVVATRLALRGEILETLRNG
jgi:putative ABC transport system permease protein